MSFEEDNLYFDRWTRDAHQVPPPPPGHWEWVPHYVLVPYYVPNWVSPGMCDACRRGGVCSCTLNLPQIT